MIQIRSGRSWILCRRPFAIAEALKQKEATLQEICLRMNGLEDASNALHGDNRPNLTIIF